MFLSKLLLQGEQYRNPYEIHRSLWTAFPEMPEHNRDFLFRVEQRSSRKVQVLMQSFRPPEIDSNTLLISAIKEFEWSLIEGSHLQFLLVANPVKTINDARGRLDRKGRVKKCRVPLIREDDQKAWLARKLDQIADVKALDIEKQAPLYFKKHGKAGKVQQFAFKGVLKVTNATSLLETLRIGVGPAKAFGCGLLSLART